MNTWHGRNQTSNLTLEERFWEKVAIERPNDCWEWQAGCNSSGYGLVYINGHKSEVSNRLTWWLTRGEIPDLFCVLHKCDNRKCCNPNHLFLGTYLDNIMDRHEKGRDGWLEGEDHPGAKLTDEDVKEIRHLYSTGNYTQQEIAKGFPVGRSQIANILCGLEWKNVR